MTAVAFTINGKAVSVETEPDTALLWVVREHLKLTGTTVSTLTALPSIVNATAVIDFLPGDGYLRLNRRMVIVFAIGRKSRLPEQRWQ